MKLFFPAVGKLERLLHRGAGPEAVARRSWTLKPAEEERTRGAVFVEDELSRITGYSVDSSADAEMRRIRPGMQVRRATVAHELRDVVLCGGDLYKGPYKRVVRGGRRKGVHRLVEDIDNAGVLASSWFGGRFFGHWLAEDTSLKLMSGDFGGASELAFAQTDQQAAYNRLLGIAPRILPDDCVVRRLVLVDTDLCSSYRDIGWARITAAIRARHGASTHAGCMLLRGDSGLRRVLTNEAEIADRLARRGFRIIDPQTATLDQILAAATGARVVVGVEGSQLAHGFHALADGGAMLVLQPPNRFGGIYKDRCDRKRALYAFTIGRDVPGGFAVDPDGVERILDRVVTELTNGASRDG